MNEAALRYWSFARQKLRFTDAEFWALTPREFQALADGWEDDQSADDRRVATICMVLANCNRDPKKRPEPFTVRDYMPQRSAEPAPEQSWETQKSIFGAIAEAARRENK